MKISKATISFLFLCLFILAPETQAATRTSTSTEAVTQAESEKRVREYFKDIPIMIEIARCESNFRQFTDAGNVLLGGDSGGMIGVFQFFGSIHAIPAKALGFDIATLEGNLGYAKHLYKEQNTVPWNQAKDCWDITPAKKVAKNVDKEKLRQQITLLIKIITLLQKQLDAKSLTSR
jgi:hypothetical protein